MKIQDNFALEVALGGIRDDLETILDTFQSDLEPKLKQLHNEVTQISNELTDALEPDLVGVAKRELPFASCYSDNLYISQY